MKALHVVPRLFERLRPIGTVEPLFLPYWVGWRIRRVLQVGEELIVGKFMAAELVHRHWPSALVVQSRPAQRRLPYDARYGYAAGFERYGGRQSCRKHTSGEQGSVHHRFAKKGCPAAAAITSEVELRYAIVWTSILRSHKGLARVAFGERPVTH